VRIVDRGTGYELPARYVGEITLMGPSVMSGYFNDARATSSVLQSDGWLWTGDLGYKDESGRIYICGRAKNVIIVNGRNYHPEDIERVVGALPGVRLGKVGAFQIEHLAPPAGGVFVVAELRGGADGNRAQASAEVARREVRHALGLHVQNILFVRPHSIPTTSSGKVRRELLRSMYMEGQLEVPGQ
jgi:fatty-acyl-CoA synthase